MGKKVEVDVDQLEELLDDALFLEALREAGVDNWEGYSDAQEIYCRLKEEEE